MRRQFHSIEKNLSHDYLDLNPDRLICGIHCKKRKANETRLGQNVFAMLSNYNLENKKDVKSRTQIKSELKRED